VRSRLAALAALVLVGLGLGVPDAQAAASLRITPLTWNVLGLDSNDPTTGPSLYPVGARVCNTGSSTATGVVAQLLLGSGSSYLVPVGPTSLAKGSLAPGRCVDAYFAVRVSTVTAAYDDTRPVRVTARATGLSTVSTPVNRELYVERLISQNRNQVHSLTGPATVYVGGTYRYTLVSETAPGGYEQLESHINLNPSLLELLRVDTRYSTPGGATNDTVYADACGWDEVPTSASYLSCVGPEGFVGGKAGGSITTTYTVRVRAAGSQVLTGVIYDKSGSSYHYNTDYDTAGNRLLVTALEPPDLSVTKTHATSPWAPGGTGTWTLTVRNVGGSATTGTTTVTDTVPVGATPLSATGTGWTCSISGRTVTCTRTAPLAAGATSAVTLVVRVAADAPSSLVNTARVDTPNDVDASNDADTDTAFVAAPEQQPAAAGQAPGSGAAPTTPGAATPPGTTTGGPAVAPAPARAHRGPAAGGPLPVTGAPLIGLTQLAAGSLLAGCLLLAGGLVRRRPADD